MEIAKFGCMLRHTMKIDGYRWKGLFNQAFSFVLQKSHVPSTPHGIPSRISTAYRKEIRHPIINSIKTALI